MFVGLSDHRQDDDVNGSAGCTAQRRYSSHRGRVVRSKGKNKSRDQEFGVVVVVGACYTRPQGATRLYDKEQTEGRGTYQAQTGLGNDLMFFCWYPLLPHCLSSPHSSSLSLTLASLP